MLVMLEAITLSLRIVKETNKFSAKPLTNACWYSEDDYWGGWRTRVQSGRELEFHWKTALVINAQIHWLLHIWRLHVLQNIHVITFFPLSVIKNLFRVGAYLHTLPHRLLRTISCGMEGEPFPPSHPPQCHWYTCSSLHLNTCKQ